jgi:uncharacterized protein (DUF1501 family)
MFNRRHILFGLTALTGLGSLRPSQLFAESGTDRRFILVILRGALDGLAAVPPVGEATYASARGTLALAKSDVIALDSTFALHPALKLLQSYFEKGELVLFHAVGTSYRGRSHFDGQDILENGTDVAHGMKSGWLARALNAGPANVKAIAIAQNMPLVLRGASAATCFAPSQLPAVEGSVTERLMDLYARDALLQNALSGALETEQMTGEIGAGRGAGYADTRPQFAAAARLLADPAGPRIATIELGGWDTHAYEGTSRGSLALRLQGLATGLHVLATDLGAAVWDKTAILVTTEFGRTVSVNGSGGSDHGTGAVAFLMGGAVRGGRVIADWPGLARANLYEGRDLKATIDLRAIFKAVLRDHLAVPEKALENEVFPQTAHIPSWQDLIRV